MEEFGIPGTVLMENAGRAVVEVMQREYGDLRGKLVAVVCGTGNNGGDGFVIARYLYLSGAVIWPFIIGDKEKIHSDAKTHLMIMRGLFINVGNVDDFDAFMDFRDPDFLVDALLGTGIENAPREPVSSVIKQINQANCPVISVDVPSGLASDTGATPGEVINATHTVTFAYPKLGLFLPPGSDCVGKLHIADIGFDWDMISDEVIASTYTNDEAKDSAAARFLKRKGEANKGDFGHVAVIAGSRGMVGAPSLVAHGAQRVGAGLVTVLTADSAQTMVAAKLNEQMTLPLPDADGALTEAAFDAIAKFAEKATVLCIGPGLTQNEGTVKLVQRLLTEIEKPIILDADGLNALSQNPDLIDRRTKSDRAPLLITPHPGEAARLLGTSTGEVQSNRVATVKELARKYHAVAVLKGRFTLISDPSGKVIINTTGNPGMATGGSGDTLTGILGGLLSQAFAHGNKTDSDDEFLQQSAPPLEVAALGVYLHGLAGDIAAERIGNVGLIAGDIIEAVPAAIQRLKE